MKLLLVLIVFAATFVAASALIPSGRNLSDCARLRAEQVTLANKLLDARREQEAGWVSLSGENLSHKAAVAYDRETVLLEEVAALNARMVAAECRAIPSRSPPPAPPAPLQP